MFSIQTSSSVLACRKSAKNNYFKANYGDEQELNDLVESGSSRDSCLHFKNISEHGKFEASCG